MHDDDDYVCSLLFGSSSSKYVFGSKNANQEQNLTYATFLKNLEQQFFQ